LLTSMSLQGFIDLFGYGICHQIPQRSLQFGGLYFPDCARDTGIHIGFVAALVAAGLVFFIQRRRGRKTPGNLPPAWALVVIACLLIPMAVDGASSYLGLRPTTNLLRYLTGMFAGIGAGSLVVPLLNSQNSQADKELKAFNKPRDLIVQIVVAVALSLILLKAFGYLGQAAAFIEMAAILAFFSSLNLLILSTIMKRRRILHFWQWLPWIGLALLMTLVELAFLGLLRYLLLDQLLARFGLWPPVGP